MGNDQEKILFSSFVGNGKFINNNGIIDKSNFKFMEVIGRGGFSQVWKVLYLKYNKLYALKKMYKVELIDKKSEKDILIELSLLSRIHHPFIVNIHFAFQDKDYLYLVSDYFPNGDLRYELIHNKMYSEKQIKFIISNILLSLEYIHENNIIHRDIKPENILIDEKGYLAITDFGIARFKQKNNYNEKSGTPGYMAPEVMFSQNHTFAVDYYALGIIGYELIFGKRPYINVQRKALKEEIFAKEAQIKKYQLPLDFTPACINFINKMIKRKQTDRLGYGNIKKIFEHPWLSDVDFKNLYLKKEQTPLNIYVNPNGNYDLKNVNYNRFLYLTSRTKARYQKIILNRKQYEDSFKDYYFYFNEFDLFDRKNTKIVNKFINPHKKYSDLNNDENNINENNYFEIADENNNKSNILTNASTGTITNVEHHADYFLLKNRIYSSKKLKIYLDKDKNMDKEVKDLLKEEENNYSNLSFDNDIKKINTINNSKLKYKIRMCLNEK